MSNYAADVPLINVPFVTSDGRVSEAWFMFLIQLFRRTGGATGDTSSLNLTFSDVYGDATDSDISSVSLSTSEALTEIQLLPDDVDTQAISQAINGINALWQTAVDEASDKAKNSDFIARSTELSLILEDAQNVLAKMRSALQDAIIDQMTPIDPIRSMAYQDSGNVKITGGSISGLTTNNATGANLTDDTTTNATMYPVFGAGSGGQPLKISTTKLKWNPSTGVFNVPSLSASGQIVSTLATGTAPLSIASTTVVPNLNVSQLLGNTWGVPGTIGSTTPNTGAFTSLTANTTLESQVQFTGQITMRPNDTRSSASRNWAFMANRAAFGDWCLLVSTTNTNDPATVKLQYSGGLVVTDGFGCNGKTAQAAFSLGAAATDLASVITLANNLRTMSINNGTGV